MWSSGEGDRKCKGIMQEQISWLGRRREDWENMAIVNRLSLPILHTVPQNKDCISYSPLQIDICGLETNSWPMKYKNQYV